MSTAPSSMVRIEDLETAKAVLTEMQPEFVYRANNRSHAAYEHVINQITEVMEKARQIDGEAHLGGATDDTDPGGSDRRLDHHLVD